MIPPLLNSNKNELIKIKTKTNSIIISDILRYIDEEFKIKEQLLSLKDESNNSAINTILWTDEINEYVNQNTKYKEFFKNISFKEFIKDLKKSKKDNYIMFHYWPVIQHNMIWNKLTRQLRWIVLDIKNNFGIVAYPFDKFFNLNEYWIEEVQLDKIPKNEEFVLTDKLDWSLWILFFNKKKDRYEITTKWSFYSNEWREWTDILYNKYKSSIEKNKEEIDKYFLMFEIISPKNKIVLEYNWIRDIFLIWARNKETLELLSQEELNKLGKTLWFKRPEVYNKKYNNISEVAEDMAKIKGKEGVVVYFKGWLILKIKTEQYIALHKIVSNFWPKTILEWFLEWRTLEEINTLHNIPEEFEKEGEYYYNVFKKYFNSLFKQDFKQFKWYIKKIEEEIEKDKEKNKRALYFSTLDNLKKTRDLKKTKDIEKIYKLFWVIYFNNNHTLTELNNQNNIGEYRKKHLESFLKDKTILNMFDNIFNSEVIFTIWIPWSWKSTFTTKKMENNANEIILSSDEIRKEMYWTYNKIFENKNIDVKKAQEKVFNTMMERLKEELEEIQEKWIPKKIVLDATFVSEKDRNKFKQLLIQQQYDIRTKAIVFNIHPKFANMLNKEREKDKIVPKNVIMRMFWRLQIPQKGEFDKIEIIKVELDEQTEYIKQIVNYIEKFLNNTKDETNLTTLFENTYEYKKAADINNLHISKYHQEDLQTHLKNVVNEALKLWNNKNLSEDCINNLLVATYFHDLGKVYTVKKIEDKKTNVIKHIFQWHEQKSYEIFQFFKPYLREIEEEYKLDVNIIEKVILHHDIFQKWEIKTKDDIEKKLKDINANENEKLKKLLYYHSLCDKNWARQTEEVKKKDNKKFKLLKEYYSF